ncbi:MAG: YdcF family protein [Rhizomicrobium sp.]
MLYLLLTRYLFDPLAWVLYLLIGGLVAGHFQQAALQRGLTIGATVLLLCLLVLPLDQMLARPLENRYPRPPLPAQVDGIVILDGGLNPRIFRSRGVTGENASTMRMIAGADLARRFPAAKLVFSGTSGRTPLQQEVEHETAEALLLSLGVAPGRTIFERTSRDTGENLVNCKALLHPKDGETWVLVTSAIHMPRAMAIAQKLGWKMVPWPSDYISATGGGALRIGYPSEGLTDIDRALHEWIGMVSYRLRGKAE